MIEFYDFIKNFIKEKFDNDTEISGEVKIYDAYTVGHTPSPTQPEIQFQIMNNYEYARATSFYDGENASVMPMQLTAYVGQQKVNGITRNAREVAIIYGEKIKKYLNELKTDTIINKNVLATRHITTSPALPMQGGEKIYTTAIRYEFVIANPYEIGE